MPNLPRHRRIVAGVDGSPNSLAALRRAAAEAQRRHTSLDVIRVLPGGRLRSFAGTGSEWLRLRALVARTLPADQHLTTRLHLSHGDPAAALIKAARDADLLVIGARENSLHGDPLGGHTVPAVLSEIPCEVIVCVSADQSAAIRDT
jgi:nucleotide-binding universal stress UspA family protein